MASMLDMRAYHIITYGTFVGTTFFQSFVSGIVAYKTLPRPLFSRLQAATFPVFFAIQTVLGLALAVTYPGESPVRLSTAGERVNKGIRGLAAEENLYIALAPITFMVLTSLANLLYVGPAATTTMKQRHHQETKDGKKSNDAGPHSAEMHRLNKRFGILHSVSTLLALGGYGASLFYGFILASRLS